MVNYRPGIAFINKLSGSGPFVYLLITKGNIICNGINGTAKRPSFSRGTPYSINLITVIDSVAKAIYKTITSE